MPCRGTGEVVSNLGGSASMVSCPWCGGTGKRVAGIDAQAKWLEPAGETVEGNTAHEDTRPERH
jgi:hypothetical protein